MSPRAFYDVFHPQAGEAWRALDGQRAAWLASKREARAAYWAARAQQAAVCAKESRA